jgi:hypothetical protein
VIIAEEIGPGGLDSGRCFACEMVGIVLVGRSRDASTWERLRPILIQMSGPVSLRLVALLAFDTVVGEGEGFLVVPAAIHYS